MKIITIGTVAFLLAGSTAMAGEFGIGLGYQQNNLSGDALYEGSVANPTKVDLEDTLGMDDSDGTFKPTLYYKSGKHTFSFDYEALSYSGNTTITETIRFGDETYNVSDQVQSNMDLDWYTLGYRYGIYTQDKLNVGIGIDINLIDTELALKTTFVEESVDELIPLPALALDIAYDFGPASLNANIAGITAGSSGYYVDMYGGFSFDLEDLASIKGASLDIGYQYKKLDVDVDDLEAQMTFDGLYGGISYRF